MDFQKLLAGLVVGLLLGFLLRPVLFLPYRNMLMKWWMKTFSANYKLAKGVFDQIIEKAESGSYAEYFSLLLSLQEDKRFKSLDDTEKALGFQKEEPSLEELIQGGIFYRGIEMFSTFFGRGRHLHRVTIIFFIKDDIQVHSVELAYQEEYGPDTFLYSIENRKFPPGSNGRRGRRRVVLPDGSGPTHGKEIDIKADQKILISFFSFRYLIF